MKGYSKALLICFAAAILAAMAPVSGETPTSLNDDAIAEAVQKELANDPAVASHNIDVLVTEGVVNLSGTTDNILAKERAVEVCQSVKGVRSVINRIFVKPVPRSDEEISEAVAKALFSNPATESYEVTPHVEKGVVTLTGEVDSWQERELSATVAKQISGVVRLENRITIDFAQRRSDPEIAKEIRESLRWDARVDHALIEVEVEEGNVTLSGVVGSAAEKSRAANDARVLGVDSVDTTDLHVESWAREKRLRQDKYTKVSDEAIKDAIEDTFLYDPRVKSSNPQVTVESGTVTLTGRVEDLLAKKAAAENAENVVGVFRVNNHLRVRPPDPLADDEIHQQLRNSLLMDPYLDRFDLDTAVVNGRAHLWGEVDNAFQRTRAERVAAQIPGVIEIENHLSVEDDLQAQKRDWEIREDIRKELFWSPFVDAGEVTVSVNSGIATLTGTVDTWSEWKAAEANAMEGGAVSVNNNLKVTEGAPEDHSRDSWWPW